VPSGEAYTVLGKFWTHSFAPSIYNYCLCFLDAEGGDEVPTGEACTLFGKFWAQYGQAMKLGIVEDSTNRNRMAKLLRFHTSKCVRVRACTGCCVWEVLLCVPCLSCHAVLPYLDNVRVGNVKKHTRLYACLAVCKQISQLPFRVLNLLILSMCNELDCALIP